MVFFGEFEEQHQLNNDIVSVLYVDYNRVVLRKLAKIACLIFIKI